MAVEFQDDSTVLHITTQPNAKNPILNYEQLSGKELSFNNINDLHGCLEVMREFEVNKMVFSSSATVYGAPKTVPITEDMPLSTTNPYGTTKLYIEQILQDLPKQNPKWWCKVEDGYIINLLTNLSKKAGINAEYLSILLKINRLLWQTEQQQTHRHLV